MPTISKPSRKAGDAKAAADDADLDAPELDDEFFETAVVGKHYFEAMRESNVVRIEADVAEHFPNERAVNDALRTLIGLRRILNAEERRAP